MPQFSIRFLLGLTAAIAAGVAAAAVRQSVDSIWAIDGVTLLYLTASVFGARLTNGKVQAFWIGAGLVFGIGAISSAGMNLRSNGFVSIDSRFAEMHRFSQLMLWYAAPINGIFAVALHWLFTPRQE